MGSRNLSAGVGVHAAELPSVEDSRERRSASDHDLDGFHDGPRPVEHQHVDAACSVQMRVGGRQPDGDGGIGSVGRQPLSNRLNIGRDAARHDVTPQPCGILAERCFVAHWPKMSDTRRHRQARSRLTPSGAAVSGR